VVCTRVRALGWFIDVLSLTAAPLPLEVRAAAAAERPPVERPPAEL
jgi:hypothetical protein